MKKYALILPALCALGFVSTTAARAENNPLLLAQLEDVRAAATASWDPVRAANVMGAMDWCLANATAKPAERDTYRLLGEGASRALDVYVSTGDITVSEATLIRDRVRDQGYYMGLELNDGECENLRSTVINWSPWQLVTSRDAGFAIEMPSLPVRRDLTESIDGRNFDWVLYDTLITPEYSPLLADEEYYTVGYVMIPENYLDGKSSAEIFDTFGGHLFEKMGLPELQDSSREETTDGVPSRIIIGEAYGQSVAAVMYLVDDRFYVNLMVGQEPQHFERFFRSFEALDFVDVGALPSALMGTVTYRSRIGLPSGSVVKVSLVDVSQEEVVAEQTIVTSGEQVPLPFQLAYSPDDLDPGRSYEVRAQIAIGDEMRWTASVDYPEPGSVSSLEIVVKPAQ